MTRVTQENAGCRNASRACGTSSPGMRPFQKTVSRNPRCIGGGAGELHSVWVMRIVVSERGSASQPAAQDGSAIPALRLAQVTRVIAA